MAVKKLSAISSGTPWVTSTDVAVGVRSGTTDIRSPIGYVSDAGTNAVVNVFTVGHDSSGTPTTNFGTGVLFQGQDSTTAGQSMAAIQASWTTATHASRASSLAFQTLTAAGSLTTQMTLNGVGNATLVGKYTNYGNVATVGMGVAPVYGLDSRTGLTSADGAPITLYTPTAANQLYRVMADIFATATVTGTATYTIAWTENGTAQTLAVTATTVNVLGTVLGLIRPDNGTAITAQLTGTFTGTFTVAGVVERIA